MNLDMNSIKEKLILNCFVLNTYVKPTTHELTFPTFPSQRVDSTFINVVMCASSLVNWTLLHTKNKGHPDHLRSLISVVANRNLECLMS